MTWHLFHSHEPKKAIAADQALKNAKDRLQQVQRRGQEVHEVTEQLRAYREHNHFAELLRDALRRI